MRSGLSLRDIDYLVRDAREAIRKTFYRTLEGERRDGQETFSERAVAICYALHDDRSPAFAVRFFDWESDKRDENPLVYRLGRGDTSNPRTRIVTLPRAHSGSSTGSGSGSPADAPSDDEDEEMEVIIKVEYALGVQEQSIYVSAPFSQALFEGRLCACCRFHEELTDHAQACKVHGSYSL